jgi:hypothetical protein
MQAQGNQGRQEAEEREKRKAADNPRRNHRPHIAPSPNAKQKARPWWRHARSLSLPPPNASGINRIWPQQLAGVERAQAPARPLRLTPVSARLVRYGGAGALYKLQNVTVGVVTLFIWYEERAVSSCPPRPPTSLLTPPAWP